MDRNLKLVLTLIGGVIVLNKVARSKRVCLCFGPACVCSFRR